MGLQTQRKSTKATFLVVSHDLGHQGKCLVEPCLPVTTKHNFAKPCFSLFVFSSYYVVVFFVLLFFRLRVPCCLSFACVACVVGDDIRLTSFDFISIVISKSLLVVFSFPVRFYRVLASRYITLCSSHLHACFPCISHGLVDGLIVRWVGWLPPWLLHWLT